MEKDLDRICIELKVVAVQMGEDIWMQGDLEVVVNGESPYSIDDIVDTELLLESLKSEGEYFIFSCCCGVPECGGWLKGIDVYHQGSVVKWVDSSNDKTWYFDRSKIENNLKNVREKLERYNKYFHEKQIQYVGVGCNW